MTAHTNGWYKYTFTGVDKINMIFNNGNSGVGTNQTANIVDISAHTTPTDQAQMTITVEVETLDHLNVIMQHLRQIRTVITVRRL